MEKPAKRFRKNIAGLLILFFLSAGTSLSARVSWAYLWGMRFRPTQDTLFTEDDNSFFVEIENVTPDSVQISVNSLPPNVSFRIFPGRDKSGCTECHLCSHVSVRVKVR